MDSDNFLVYFHLKRPFIDNANTTFMHNHILDEAIMRCLTIARLGMSSFILKSFHLKIQSFVNEMRALPPPGKI